MARFLVSESHLFGSCRRRSGGICEDCRATESERVYEAVRRLGPDERREFFAFEDQPGCVAHEWVVFFGEQVDAWKASGRLVLPVPELSTDFRLWRGPLLRERG